MVLAGTLDRRLMIQQEQILKDPAGTGEDLSTWLPWASVWAKAERPSAREQQQAEQIAAKVDTRFTIRYLRDLSPKGFRLVDSDGRVYDISGVREIGRRDGLEVLAWGRGE